jgi:hypothetical protein
MKVIHLAAEWTPRCVLGAEAASSRLDQALPPLRVGVIERRLDDCISSASKREPRSSAAH